MRLLLHPLPTSPRRHGYPYTQLPVKNRLRQVNQELHHHNKHDELEEASQMDAESDVVIEKDGARVVVDDASLELLAGATVDFEDEMTIKDWVKSPVFPDSGRRSN